MRLMRRKLNKAKIKILDHSPALELLYDGHGIAGAAGVQTQKIIKHGLSKRIRSSLPLEDVLF